ncbi:transcriptional regulator, TetR family [Nocardia amikacinitolerans]|uniref:Transcriptional regulator, TetR family n=1 Tax=Nocardia amikacinitolerans TaxID=756689 RepID=A0A285LSE3_9NOCA|nr:TetR/AcrR family transcriptional regulator [Nocardia amikacinitolerans]MCP2280000.1 transcriptional regulator, TetR family [Nocardia amikacinitolerans]MCP2295730.1 transcriptional regulator, TetR family [Nocardia amikacinitolerans]SNY87829.1 transcriptional regulator, TetR family [Nocardia amikacinitolerans]
MPRNRRPRDREEKRAEIVAAARRLFLEQGYEAVSVSRIAQDAGVVSNTLYWYFRDKDAVLIAVLEEVLADSMARYGEVLDTDIIDRLVWVVAELEQVSRLVTTVHARAKESETVRDWHEQFHALAEGLFRADLAMIGVPATELDAMTSIGVFVVEGLLMHPVDDERKRAMMGTLIQSARGIAVAAH